MTLRNVRLVFQKEIRDTLRDRRTLFISVVLPIFLYPLLMIGSTQLMSVGHSRIWERPQKIVVAGLTGAAAERVRERLLASKDPLAVVTSDDPEGDLAAEVIDAWIDLDADFEDALSAGRQGAVRLHYDSAKDGSKAAERKVRTVFAAYGEEVLRDRGLSEADIQPVKVERFDAATVAQRGAKVAGPLLALLLVIMAATGAFYPAVDIMAGEKERGTMETLLVCPATRTEIVLGKYFTVLTMTVVTALLNFASMGITFSHMVHLIPASGGVDMALTISPMVAGIIILALLPLAGLFSAISLALSTFARSYKEGQHYLTPLFLAIMPLAMVAMFPGTKLSTFALVPVAGVVLLVRDLLLDAAAPSQVFTVLAVTVALAGGAIWLTVRMFNREDVLFRDPGGAEFSLMQRATKAGETPRPAQALGLVAVALTLIYFIPPLLMQGEGGEPREGGARLAFYFQFLVIILGLPLIFAKLYKLDFRKTFSLKMPPVAAWPLTLAGAPAVLLAVTLPMEFVGVDPEQLRPLEEAFEELTRTVGLPLLVLLPPLAEEFFFRGFLLSAFRKANKWVGALIIVSAIFALFHFLPAKYLPTGLIGLWLGYLVIATGSLYPAILGHLVNNAIPLLMPEDSLEITLPASLLGYVVTAGVILLLERMRRKRVSGG